MHDPIGRTIGRFEVKERLGAGGMGEVYRAHDPQLQRQVAIKQLPAEVARDDALRRQLLREARSAARIVNQRVAALYDVLEETDELFLVMEYVKGTTLRARLGDALSPHDFLDLAVQCTEGLAAAHHEGIVHGDIKPENIMIVPSGDVKLLDFGVSRWSGSSGDATSVTTGAGGEVAGTLSYMPPELLMGRRSDHHADLFSLGVVFHEMLAGRHPFRAETPMATSDRILHEAQAPLALVNPRVSPALQSVVDKMLAKNPEARYATADDLLVDLRHLRSELTHSAIHPSALPRPRPAERSPWRLLAAVAFVAVLATAAWLGRGLLPGPPTGSNILPAEAATFDASDWIIAVIAASGADAADPEIAAINDGLASTLTTRLTQLTRSHNLQVIPTSALRERGVDGLESARRELGVTLVLNFESRRIGDRVRINVNLVDTEALRQIDADTVDGSIEDLIALEEQVSLRALRILRVELLPMDGDLLAAGTDQPRAYAFYLRGQGYLEDRNDPANADLAIDLFEQALRVDPEYARAHAVLGRAFWLKYELTEDPAWVDRASAACRDAIALDDLAAPGHTCLGVLLNGTGRYEEAIAELEQSRRIEPTDDAVYIELGKAYLGAGQVDRAEATYEEAIAVRPHYWAGYSWLGVFYYRQGRTGEAIAAWEQSALLAPDSYRSFSNLGAAYFRAERWPDARRAFERALELNPEYSRAYGNLGVLYFYEARYDAAEPMFQRAVQAQPGNYLAHGNLADLYYWAPGKRDRAEAAYRHAIALAQQDLAVNPNDAIVHQMVARYYAMVGDEDAAHASTKTALDLAPSDVDVMQGAAQVHAVLGDNARALEYLLMAIEAGYSRAEIRVDPIFAELRQDARLREALGTGKGP